MPIYLDSGRDVIATCGWKSADWMDKMKQKNPSKDLLLAQKNEMNEYYHKYRQLVDSGQVEMATEYYRKTLETANEIVLHGQKLLEELADKMENKPNEGLQGSKSSSDLMYIKPKDDVLN
jgi:hypothetical protein